MLIYESYLFFLSGVCYTRDNEIIRSSVPRTQVMGPGHIAQAHQDDEWVDIAQLLEMRRIVPH